MNFQEQQKEILKCSNDLDQKLKGKGRSWAKYKGDVIMRKIIKLIDSNLPSAYKMVGPNVFINDLPIEIDAAIVKEEVKSLDGTNAYAKSDVKLILEVKKFGNFDSQITAPIKMKEYLNKLELVGIPFLYISIREGAEKIRITKAVFGERAFFLAERRSALPIDDARTIREGEWKAFIKKATSYLK